MNNVNDIIYLLKFGEKENLNRLKEGFLYFSNAKRFHEIERNQQIKGQGDLLENGAQLFYTDISFSDVDSKSTKFNGLQGKVEFFYEPSELIPVYCLFSCFEKDCIKLENGNYSINLDSEIKSNIITHFPKADAVAIIKKPKEFIENVISTIGTVCKNDLVHYFNLTGLNNGKGMENDDSYFKFLGREIYEEGSKYPKYSFYAEDVYKALFCKDKYFEKEQEYRFVLPTLRIGFPTEFKIDLNENIDIIDLDEFWNTNQ